MTQVMTGGVSYLNYDTPSVFAFGESTSLIEGGKGAPAPVSQIQVCRIPYAERKKSDLSRSNLL